MANGKAALIRRRSKTPGVMITQYEVSLPEGKSTPDFQSAPVPVTIKEGKLAVFKAMVRGDPKPEVSWRRAKGNISDKDKYQTKYEKSTGEYILEIHKVSAADTDTYKCCAVNEYGKAVCTATLSVADASTNPSDFRKLLRKSKAEQADGETDETFWDAMLDADTRDYERICSEFGVTDLYMVLKKLEEKKRQRMENKCKDGAIPSDENSTEKHNVNGVARTKDFSIKSVLQENTGLTQLDVEKLDLLQTALNQADSEEIKLLLTEFKLSNVDFVVKIQEIKAQEREDALFECLLTHPLPSITWMGKGSTLEDGEKYSITVSDHKLIHRLLIKDCMQLDKGIYSAVAGITSCNAWLVVEADSDPTPACKKKPRRTAVAGGAQIDLDKVAKEQQMKNQEEMEKILAAVKEKRKRQGPLIEDLVIGDYQLFMIDPGVHFICGLSDVSAIISENAELTCKLSSGDCDGAWFRDGKKISPDDNFIITKDGAIHKLMIIRCTEEHSGKYRFEADGRKTEAMINVKDPPRFDCEDLSAFTEPVIVKVGHNAIFKLHFVGHEPIKIQWYREGDELHDDSNTKIERFASHSRLLLSRCQRKETGEIKIKLKNEHGFTEAISQLIVLAFPGPPAPPKVVSAYDDCINLCWTSPINTGGSRILGYILEKRKKGSNLWTVVNAVDGLIKEKKYGVKDVVAGMEYEFRVTAINLSGPGESSNPSEFVFARDPKQPPGKVTGLKVTETSYTHLVLTWTKPEEKPGIQDEAKGYFVEIRQADCIEWSRCISIPIIMTSFSVKGLKSMEMYWVRVIAINDGGESAPEELANYVLAMPSPVRPKFTNHKMKSFVVVRAGNSVRITVHFEASPRPTIVWLKDNVPVAKRATISNSDGSSQLLIPSSERSDSGIYSILVKNLAGQETFSTEVRVTDDPKPPGLVELEENVPGTVTVMWEPSPDEKRDDRLHYTVSKLDSTKNTWTTVADRLFNNKVTVCNIMHGREYHFRVYAKNDIGISAHSESPTWGMEKKKQKFVVNIATMKDCDLRCAPTFIVPLKLRTAPKGYECYMSCAVKGDPTPRITWYRNHISLNTNTNYYISNTCGVCSMLILRVGPKDVGEYTITAENNLGRAESSTILSVRGETATQL
nr:PREDICTED: immunoglobulin-like and fibronectin type III domain-containing protein 1 [Paralichthys olivaceus]